MPCICLFVFSSAKPAVSWDKYRTFQVGDHFQSHAQKYPFQS